jgi:hypothetical protein
MFGTPTILRTTILRTTIPRTTNLRTPESDHSLNDHTPKATILRTTNLRKRPILGRLIIAKPEPQWAQFSQWLRTEKNIFNLF